MSTHRSRFALLGHAKGRQPHGDGRTETRRSGDTYRARNRIARYLAVDLDERRTVVYLEDRARRDLSPSEIEWYRGVLEEFREFVRAEVARRDLA
jgi:hypothetical protein